jgi:glutamate 5-kinase
MKKPILVIKFGSASLANKQGEIDETILESIAKQVASLHQQYHVVIVSSGAVAAGKGHLKNYSGSLTERKAAASIGNPLLLKLYSTYFSAYGIQIGQSLCERQHFSDRSRFLQLKKTYETLWENNIIPIANENDVVSNLELRFSDNDELATLIAVGFGASILLFSTSVPGVLDKNGKVIDAIPFIDKEILGLANKEKSALGLGGMISKLTFARLATRMGIKTVIFGLKTNDGIIKAVNGETGTCCFPLESNTNARKKWLASGSLVTGKLQVDAGASNALLKGQSLLVVGVKSIIHAFEAGEVFEIIDEIGQAIAVGRSKISSEDIVKHKGKQNLIIAHADDVVVI